MPNAITAEVGTQNVVLVETVGADWVEGTNSNSGEYVMDADYTDRVSEGDLVILERVPSTCPLGCECPQWRLIET